MQKEKQHYRRSQKVSTSNNMENQYILMQYKKFLFSRYMEHKNQNFMTYLNGIENEEICTMRGEIESIVRNIDFKGKVNCLQKYRIFPFI